MGKRMRIMTACILLLSLSMTGCMSRTVAAPPPASEATLPVAETTAAVTEPATEPLSVPETTTTVTEPPQKDLSAEAETLLIGQWKLDYVLDGLTFDMVPVDGDITFQINENHTATITTPDENYSYDWVYNVHSYEDDDPDKLILHYLLFDAEGNEIFFSYYYDDTIFIFTEEYSVFFAR